MRAAAEVLEVLVLCDDAMYESPVSILRNGGYQVTETNSEATALSQLRSDPDLVLVTGLTVFPTSRILHDLARERRPLLNRVVAVTPCADAFRKLAPGCCVVDQDSIAEELVFAVDGRFAAVAANEHAARFAHDHSQPPLAAAGDPTPRSFSRPFNRRESAPQDRRLRLVVDDVRPVLPDNRS